MKVFWRDRPVEKGSWLQWVKQAFLPEGYPNSVTPDYLEYQKFDTIQAMSSSLVGSLASAGMLKAAGVGDAEATALGSAMNFLLGDLVGMVTQILFAWLKSSSLDAFSKQYRLCADVANDLALLVGILASKRLFLLALCCRSVLHAVVGVAGTATRAAVVVHQARGGKGNVSDVAAKDGSQETLVNLAALVVSYCVLPFVVANNWTWHVYLLLSTCHIWANFRAVSALHFVHLNPFRLDLLLSSFFSSRSLVSPALLNAREPVAPHRVWRHRARFPALALGVAPDQPAVVRTADRFLLGMNWASFRRGAGPLDVLEAYFALRNKGSSEGFPQFQRMAREAGYDLERISLCVGEFTYETKNL